MNRAGGNAILSGPTRSRIACATVVLPEPEPPAIPIVRGAGCMRRLYLPHASFDRLAAAERLHAGHERQADRPRPRVRTDHGTHGGQDALNGSQLTCGSFEQLPRLGLRRWRAPSPAGCWSCP